MKTMLYFCLGTICIVSCGKDKHTSPFDQNEFNVTVKHSSGKIIHHNIKGTDVQFGSPLINETTVSFSDHKSVAFSVYVYPRVTSPGTYTFACTYLSESFNINGPGYGGIGDSLNISEITSERMAGNFSETLCIVFDSSDSVWISGNFKGRTR